MVLGFIAPGFLSSGSTQVLRLSYFIGSCYLVAPLSVLGVNASVRLFIPGLLFCQPILCDVLRAL